MSRLRTSFFYIRAEDGIRDTSVTGVQTCALPISVMATRCLTARLSPSGGWHRASGPGEHSGSQIVGGGDHSRQRVPGSAPAVPGTGRPGVSSSGERSVVDDGVCGVILWSSYDVIA